MRGPGRVPGSNPGKDRRHVGAQGTWTGLAGLQERSRGGSVGEMALGLRNADTLMESLWISRRWATARPRSERWTALALRVEYLCVSRAGRMRARQRRICAFPHGGRKTFRRSFRDGTEMRHGACGGVGWRTQVRRAQPVQRDAGSASGLFVGEHRSAARRIEGMAQPKHPDSLTRAAARRVRWLGAV